MYLSRTVTSLGSFLFLLELHSAIHQTGPGSGLVPFVYSPLALSSSIHHWRINAYERNFSRVISEVRPCSIRVTHVTHYVSGSGSFFPRCYQLHFSLALSFPSLYFFPFAYLSCEISIERVVLMWSSCNYTSAKQSKQTCVSLSPLSPLLFFFSSCLSHSYAIYIGFVVSCSSRILSMKGSKANMKAHLACLHITNLVPTGHISLALLFSFCLPPPSSAMGSESLICHHTSRRKKSKKRKKETVKPVWGSRSDEKRDEHHTLTNNMSERRTWKRGVKRREATRRERRRRRRRRRRSFAN
ncbi:MAG: hypothetical protein J3R72DRAFT_438194 [Linnemannia gamsii]|nr:MAG: hypothetical protein J3R72DRAFT_438194 [Linnemannia gamsii]